MHVDETGRGRACPVASALMVVRGQPRGRTGHRRYAHREGSVCQLAGATFITY